MTPTSNTPKEPQRPKLTAKDRAILQELIDNPELMAETLAEKRRRDSAKGSSG